MNPGRGTVLSGLLLSLFCLGSPLPGKVDSAFMDRHAGRMEALFSHLDPELEGMEEILAFWESGQAVAAAEALCDYMAEKSFPFERLDAPVIPANVIEQADAATQGKFFLLNHWEAAPREDSGKIDWEGTGSRDDKERAWMLNRHAFILYLAEAEQRTGDQHYADALNDLLKDWILRNPYPDHLTFSAQWRALEVARRILNAWVYVFFGYNALDDETRLLVLSSVLDHADALSEHTSFWGGNHLITEKMALLLLAMAWPEFKDAAQWRDEAVRTISDEFLSQTYPDGSYKELSNHYQRVVLTNATRFLKLLEGTDHRGTNSAVVDRIEQMWDFFAATMRPDGFGPLNNASDQEHNASFVREVWEQFDRPDWLYMATNGTEGSDPSGPESNPSRLFPWAGQAILRTGWERGAGWVYFDAGPYGTAHQHVDRLHVSAALAGRPILVDNGRYKYRPGPWKDYFQGPASHNILLLNGQPAEQAPREVRRPLPVNFEELEAGSYASARAYFKPSPGSLLFPDLMGSIPWSRSVILDQKGRFALIVDHLVSFLGGSWTAQWHFHPDLSEAEAIRSLSLVHGEADRITTRSGSGPPHIAGFHSPRYNLRQPAIQRDYSGSLQGPVALAWLLQSPDPASPEIRVEVLSSDPILRLLVRQAGEPIARISLQLHPEPQLLGYEAF